MPRIDDAASVFLGISRLKGVGFKTLRELGGVNVIADAFFASPHEFCERITKEKQPYDIIDKILARGNEALAAISEHQINLVSFEDSEYPESFNLLGEHRPLWFFYRGDVELLQTPSLAIVGTRNPSPQGAFLTRYAVSAAKELNAPIVSGLAKGVDETAHEWALLSGLKNISVLGTGLLKTYPAKNAELANKIVEQGGVLISEYLPPSPPTAESFVWRNRLQAALAKCVIAPEWKRSSGTAHTIRFAKKLQRPTINLRLNGLPLSVDHGEANLVFEVPAQHFELIYTLESYNLNSMGSAHKQENSENILTSLQRDLF